MAPQIQRLVRGLEHWQSLVGLCVIAFAYMGGKVLWPGQRIEQVAFEAETRDSVLSVGHRDIEHRLDSLSLHQEQIVSLLKIVALDACLRRTTGERQLMQLPCSQLMDAHTPIIQVR